MSEDKVLDNWYRYQIECDHTDAIKENDLRDKEKARWKEEDERYLGIQELNNDGEMGWK